MIEHLLIFGGFDIPQRWDFVQVIAGLNIPPLTIQSKGWNTSDLIMADESGQVSQRYTF